MQSVDLETWLEHLICQQQSYAYSKNIAVTFNPAKKRINVRIDKTGLEKVFINLLSNALRYTPLGGEVHISPFLTDCTFGFRVRDTGIGIPEDELKNIFNEFYRGAQAREMEKLGTGLGLNLANEIVKKYNGNIRVESDPVKRSCFTVELPLPEDESIR